MDSRRPHYAAAPPHPHTPIDNRPPPSHYPHPAQASQTPQPPPQHYSYPGPPPPPGASGPSLPPIHQPYAPDHSLPPFRHPPHPHDPREGPENHPYNQPNRSGHVTPASVNRSYSHDSSHQQHTPTTPAHPGSYPPASAPDGGPPPPPQHSMDHGGHHGYPPTNGVPHGLPPPHGHQPPPSQPPPPHHHHGHEQSHHYMTPVMENSHPYPPPGPQVSYGAPYGPTSTAYANMQKRKQMRATQACEQCRQRKQKCDEGNPCSFCKENNLSCQYRDTPPAKTDKNAEKVLHTLEQQTAALDRISRQFEDFDSRLRRIEHTASFQSTDRVPAEEPQEPHKRKPELEDHRTAPHKLIMLWPSIRPLFKDANVNVSDSYVMEAEDRGILRIYTRGEGIDEHDGTHAGGPASPARSEESSEGSAGSAPSPPDGLWGTGFPYTPASDIRRSEPPYTEGGLKPDGTLDIDVTTINGLYESYMKNMHIMHPFLDKARLRKIVDNFIKRHSTGHPNLRQKFAVGSGSESERPLKRQRSNGSAATGIPIHEASQIRKEVPERSPANAIVWLVLALGKICLHKDPLPAPVPDGKPATNNVVSHQLSGISGIAGSSPLTGPIKPSPFSPRSASTAQPTPPSTDGVTRTEPRSRRSSLDGTSAGPRNLDVIPGLAYYAKAAEILGDQGDGNDLVHAQMFLLAGLYKGQLARVKESMSWIIQAGRACLMLLDRYKLYNDNYWTAHGDIRRNHERGQARIKDKRHSLIVLASWTCLQLESDILAEMRLPSSGIQDIEDMLLMPHNMPDREEDSYEGLQQDNKDRESYDNILMFYTAQTFLRKRLNQIHKDMYGDACLVQSIPQVQEMLSGHENILSAWRETLPTSLAWRDEDPAPSDILEARLRGKYWGARYIINRPFLDYALHIMPLTTDGMTIDAAARDVRGNPRDKAEIQIFKAIELMGEKEIWQAVHRCIDAAMHSTVAFDRVPDRLIMTNIHGTAHAQFGNMLVLSATHHNPYLKQAINVKNFQPLLERTIHFLRKHQAISPTCYHDCGILESISKLLFGNAPPDQKHTFRNEVEPTSASNSFGPNT